MAKQDTLFDFGYGSPGEVASRPAWGGSKSKAARARCRAMLPCPCHRCGRIISPDDPEGSWQAGHVTDRAETEAMGLPEAETLPECTKCNLSAGGRAGAARTNARHQTQASKTTIYRECEPQWW